MRLLTTPLAITLLLSIAIHSLLLLSGKQPEPHLSQHSIIHARLDKQDRELVQQDQTGQISQHNNEQISQVSDPSHSVENQPTQQEAAKTTKKRQNSEVISSTRKNTSTVLKDITKDTAQDAPDVNTAKSEVKELVEQTEITPTQPKAQQVSQTNSDSRAQVEALEGSEDPTYTSYRRVLQQYLSQRLEANANFQGTVRLKIKLQYGSVATSVNIIQSSGNLEVDNWAKRAALAASPYPKIPKEIGSTFEFSPTLQLGKTTP